MQRFMEYPVNPQRVSSWESGIREDGIALAFQGQSTKLPNSAAWILAFGGFVARPRNSWTESSQPISLTLNSGSMHSSDRAPAIWRHGSSAAYSDRRSTPSTYRKSFQQASAYLGAAAVRELNACTAARVSLKCALFLALMTIG